MKLLLMALVFVFSGVRAHASEQSVSCELRDKPGVPVVKLRLDGDRVKSVREVLVSQLSGLLIEGESLIGSSQGDYLIGRNYSVDTWVSVSVSKGIANVVYSVNDTEDGTWKMQHLICK